MNNIKKIVAFGVLVALTGARCWGVTPTKLSPPPTDWREQLAIGVKNNNKNLVKIAIRSGANVHGQNYAFNGQNPVTKAIITSRTPLMYAAQKGYVDILEILINEGKANTSLRDSSKKTALDYAKAYTEGFIADKLPGSTRNKMIRLLTQ